MSLNMVASTSWKRQGVSRPEEGLLYLIDSRQYQLNEKAFNPTAPVMKISERESMEINYL
jgi:CMP-N-acetylneuraminic acid synthetase